MVHLLMRSNATYPCYDNEKMVHVAKLTGKFNTTINLIMKVNVMVNLITNVIATVNMIAKIFSLIR